MEMEKRQVEAKPETLPKYFFQNLIWGIDLI